MQSLFRRKSLVVWGLPLLAAGLTTALLFGALILASVEADQSASKRQEGLLNLVVAKLETSVAHNQESVTVWDDAVQRVQQEDIEWMESNLGEWMHTYFQHDAALVLTAKSDLLYEFIAAPQSSPSATDIVAVAKPMIERLRQRLKAGETSDSSTILSIGEDDLLDIRGRAAIVSAKPIVSDSGEIEQEPGMQHVHVAVRYLDGILLQQLEADYLFNTLAFVRTPAAEGGHSSVALRSSSGETIGYFQWQPFSPGSSVIRAVYPVILLVGLSVFTVMSFLCQGIWRRSRSLAASQSELRHLAMHDPLTGLVNRARFNRVLEERLASEASGKASAVLFVDLDHFKAVNDTYGHPVGDALIKEVALRLLEVAPSALVCRLGGDEFTLLCDIEDQPAIEQLAEQIVARLRMPFLIDGRHITVGASVGIAISSPGLDATDITRHADIALYHAKAAGRNT